jgi:hypothetical protein
VTWFRRGQDAPHPPAPAAATPNPDSPVELYRSIFALNRFINQSSGRLPGKAVVNARRVTDTLREVVDTSEVRPLDVYAVVSVRASLEDYLPTTLRGYLAVDHALVDAPRSSGRTPQQSLLEQLDALQSSADQVLVAARDQDVDALLTQGNFLRTKFSASDLDL